MSIFDAAPVTWQHPSNSCLAPATTRRPPPRGRSPPEPVKPLRVSPTGRAPPPRAATRDRKAPPPAASGRPKPRTSDTQECQPSPRQGHSQTVPVRLGKGESQRARGHGASPVCTGGKRGGPGRFSPRPAQRCPKTAHPVSRDLVKK